MKNRLDLIKFDSGEYGLQEVAPNGEIAQLYDNAGDELVPKPYRQWSFVRTLGQVEVPSWMGSGRREFWRLVLDAPEIKKH